MAESVHLHQSEPQEVFDRLPLLRRDCLRLKQLLEAEIRRHFLNCPTAAPKQSEQQQQQQKHQQQKQQKQKQQFAKQIVQEKSGGGGNHGLSREAEFAESTQTTGRRPPAAKRQEPTDNEQKRPRSSPLRTPLEQKLQLDLDWPPDPHESRLMSPTLWRAKSTEISNARKTEKPRRGRSRLPQQRKFRQPTRSKPSAHSERPPWTFSQRNLAQMLGEKQHHREEARSASSSPFRARPVPASTYLPPDDWTTLIDEYHGRRSRARSQSVPPASTSSQQPNPIRGRPVPLSTYLGPSPSMDELRALQRQRHSMETLAQSRAPQGMEEHSIRWHVQHRLRHQRCLASFSSRPHFHGSSLTVPDFNRLQEEFEQKLAARRQTRPTTVPRPFRLTEKPDDLHGHNCECWTEANRRMREERKTPRPPQQQHRPKWR